MPPNGDSTATDPSPAPAAHDSYLLVIHHRQTLYSAFESRSRFPMLLLDGRHNVRRPTVRCRPYPVGQRVHVVSDLQLRAPSSTSMHDKAFSLLEVVIVVAIVGVLAAIALPRMSRGQRGAGDAALETDLEVLRKAIDLFAAEHLGRYPGGDRIAGQLTQYTDIDGDAQTARDGDHVYGPYLRAIPPLPVGIRKGGAKIALSDAPGVGWIYAPASGEIRANTGIAEVSAAGVQYRDY